MEKSIDLPRIPVLYKTVQQIIGKKSFYFNRLTPPRAGLASILNLPWWQQYLGWVRGDWSAKLSTPGWSVVVVHGSMVSHQAAEARLQIWRHKKGLPKATVGLRRNSILKNVYRTRNCRKIVLNFQKFCENKIINFCQNFQRVRENVSKLKI